MTPDIDCAIACRYFREAEAIAAHDGGELWGVTLYGPILYVHPETREVVANQADARGSLTPRGDVFVGRWTETRGIATTAAWWSGVRWAVLTWPPSGDAQERARLVMHESWHRVQEDLGLPLYNEASPHLETREGGIWLQLEWRALCRALRQAGESRRNATEDALWFRLHRQSLFPDAERTERGLELSEGLAEYTGIMLSGVAPGAVANYAAEQFDRAARWPTLVRSFAYLSGPAYGILLDESGAEWRRSLTSADDLALLLAHQLGIEVPGNLEGAARKRAPDYGYEQLDARESMREESALQRQVECRSRLTDGPVLVLPVDLAQGSVSFTPTNLVPLGDRGTVYPSMGVTGPWGVLTVSGGALLNTEWTEVIVSSPPDPNA